MEQQHFDMVCHADWTAQTDPLLESWPINCVPAVAEKKPTEPEKTASIPNIKNGLGKPQAKKDLVALEQLVCEERRWMVYQRKLCCYRAPSWVVLDDHEAEVEIRRILQEFGLAQALCPRDYAEIRRLMLTRPDLQHDGNLDHQELQINFLDYTLDVLAGDLRTHSPEDRFFSYLDVAAEDVMRAVSAPQFDAFVEQLSDGNPDVKRQLLELIGIVIANCPVKQFYVLIGPSHTEKSQFGRFLEELVGREFVETIRSIDDFGDKWTMGSLHRKKLVTCLDLPDGTLSYKAIGNIKQLAGDDAVKGEYKGGALFTFYEKPLLVCAGNYPIRIPNKEKEQAFLNRMVVIPFANPIQPNAEKQHFYRQLLTEKAAIVGQALAALQDLAQRNFQVTRVPIPDEYAPEEGSASLKSVQEFLRDCCALDETAEVTTADLTAAYRASPYADVISDTNFYRLLGLAVRTIYPSVVCVKRTAMAKVRGYQGLSLHAAKAFENAE